MPVSPALAEHLAADLVEAYAEAERQMIARMAKRLAQGIDGPRWAEAKLFQIQAYKRECELLLRDLEAQARTGVETALTEAYEQGGMSAVEDIARLKPGVPPVEPLAGLRAVEALTAEMLTNLTATHRGAVTFVTNGMRTVINEATRATVERAGAQVLLGTQTLRQACQAALDRFARSGVKGFIDKAGRGWTMESYTEMAMRTGCGRAAVQGHVDRLQANGLDLVIVSDAPKECPLCLVAGTIVEGPAVEYRCRLEYSGNLISISTASGKQLCGTPEHTVLTPDGWRRLKELQPGDEVISDGGQKWDAGIMPDYEQVPTLIEEAGKLRAPLLLSGPARRYLDSDVTYREVHVVPPDSLLRDKGDPALAQPFSDLGFVRRISLSAQRFCFSDLATRLLSLVRTTPSIVRCRDHLTTLLRSGLLPTALHPCGAIGASGGGVEFPLFDGQPRRLAPSPYMLPSPAHVVRHLTPADAEDGAKLRRALAGNVTPDEIVGLSTSHFSGHVWDLQTGPSWYLSNGIISHNCRPWEGKTLSISGADTRYPSLGEAKAAGLQHANCRHSISAYQEGITKPMHNTADPEGYAATVKLRYLERRTRAAKRVQAAAMDDTAKAAAGARVRAYQAKIREHVASTPAKRQPHRERLGAL